MTFFDKFKIDQGVAVEGYIGGIGCPSSYGYEEEHNCLCSCEECWNREIPSSDKDEVWEAYHKGLYEVWWFIKKIEDMDWRELYKLFNINEDEVGVTKKIIENFTPDRAIEILKAYEDSKIEVGDVVKDNYDCKSVVLDETESYYYVFTECGCSEEWSKSICKKTGKHIDIKSILEQIGE